MRRIMMILATFMLIAGGSLFAAPQAQASQYTIGTRALIWAEYHAAGCWYSYGGESCSPGYDCSGLVQAAFAHVGVRIPRTTYEMLASPMLYRVSGPSRGVLAFFGTGHVEFVTVWPNTSFGAHDWGTRVGYAHWSPWWHPTLYMKVR